MTSQCETTFISTVASSARDVAVGAHPGHAECLAEFGQHLGDAARGASYAVEVFPVAVLLGQAQLVQAGAAAEEQPGAG
jgi:hypothetical protein